jgi:predicted lipoprotein with Yx(FWY)xxD motif
MLESPVGEFTVHRRADGTRQWAFRGAPLYSYKGDTESGDVNGRGAAPGIAPAVVLHYFLPEQIAIQRDQKNGGRLIEAATGQTLYVRDRVYYAKTSNFIRGPQRLDPTVGAAIGLSGCDARCETEWKPLLAPPKSLPQGYFGIYQRPDGTRQWSYRSYALYTHAVEPPGTLYGAESYDIAFDGGFGPVPPESHGTGLFFRGAFP